MTILVSGAAEVSVCCARVLSAIGRDKACAVAPGADPARSREWWADRNKTPELGS